MPPMASADRTGQTNNNTCPNATRAANKSTNRLWRGVRALRLPCRCRTPDVFGLGPPLHLPSGRDGAPINCNGVAFYVGAHREGSGVVDESWGLCRLGHLISSKLFLFVRFPGRFSCVFHAV